MAPQERSTYVEHEDDSRQNSSTNNHNNLSNQNTLSKTNKLSNIDLGFVNKGYENDSSDVASRITDNVATNNNRDERKKEEKKAPDFDDLLPYIGEFGLYQKILFLLMIPFAFFVAFVYFSQIFMTIAPEQHWCWVPELANLTVEER